MSADPEKEKVETPASETSQFAKPTMSGEKSNATSEPQTTAASEGNITETNQMSEDETDVIEADADLKSQQSTPNSKGELLTSDRTTPAKETDSTIQSPRVTEEMEAHSPLISPTADTNQSDDTAQSQTTLEKNADKTTAVPTTSVQDDVTKDDTEPTNTDNENTTVLKDATRESSTVSVHEESRTVTPTKTTTPPETDVRTTLEADVKAAPKKADVKKASGPEVESGQARSVSFRVGSGSSARSAVSDSTPSRTELMRRELERLQAADDEREKQAKRKQRMMVKKVKAEMDKKRTEKGIQMYPNVDYTKDAIKGVLYEEKQFALDKELGQLDNESDKLQTEIDSKYGIRTKKEGPDLIELSKEFFSKNRTDDEIPARIVKELSSQEMEDLKLVFDMFDAKGKGYINTTDLRRLAGMLGFRAKRSIFQEMIDEVAKDQKGKVTFINFLDFIVKTQGEGSDPFDEIIQGFRLIDTKNRGYITFDDLRQAADDSNILMSNRMLREMVQEADRKGDGKISQQEFTRIMLQTHRFGAV